MMTVWLAGMKITADRLNDYSLDDETTSGFSVASGWTLNNFYANRQGATVEINIYVNRSGSDIIRQLWKHRRYDGRNAPIRMAAEQCFHDQWNVGRRYC
jgi:hypothetical protein